MVTPLRSFFPHALGERPCTFAKVRQIGRNL